MHVQDKNMFKYFTQKWGKNKVHLATSVKKYGEFDRDDIINDWFFEINKGDLHVWILYASFMPSLFISGNVSCIQLSHIIWGLCKLGQLQSLKTDLIDWFYCV
jgi:hypothetical protein